MRHLNQCVERCEVQQLKTVAIVAARWVHGTTYLATVIIYWFCTMSKTEGRARCNERFCVAERVGLARPLDVNQAKQE